MDPDVFKILVDLLKLKEAPLAIFQMLKSMCAGQRLTSEPQDPAAVPLSASSVPETRGPAGPIQGLAPRTSVLTSLQPLRVHVQIRVQEANAAAETWALQRCPATLAGEDDDTRGAGKRQRSVLREEQGQRSARRRPHAGRTQWPGRIQPEDAPPAQRQPSATRLPKAGGPGKSPTRSST
ncbi:hypothetical protein CB1_000381005 [Camelus ferus]|nr:hypothetical protein CB1_000381005 [Camelus ferus]